MSRQFSLLLKGLLCFTSLAQLLVCARQQRIGLPHLGIERHGRLQFRDRRSRLIRAQQSVAQGEASGGGVGVRPERPAETLRGALRILLIQVAGAGAVGAGVVVRGQLRGARVIIEGGIKLEL